jgi:tetratricopeptide (TPR) repeat protein
MSFFGKLITPWYSGLAFSKFHRQRYEEAARLFEKVCKLDPTGDRMELVYSCLGRCYLALEKDDEALEILSNAFQLYQKRTQGPENDFERREYKELLRAYNFALEKTGLVDRAKEIAIELENVKK